MKNKIMDTKEIFKQYETANLCHPNITESFAKAQAAKTAAREKTAVSASPEAIAQALRTVYKNEGPRFINHSGATLAKLVNKVLEDEGVRCA